MADNSPRYVLSQRAADALKPILQAGATFGSRPRPIRDVAASGAAPMIYDCRYAGAAALDPDTETASRPLEIYLGDQSSATWSGTRWTIRQGGYAIVLSGNYLPSGTAPGWCRLGALTAATPAVWLCVSSNGFGGAGAVAEIVVAANTPPTLLSDGRTPCNALLVARTTSDLATLTQYHRGAVDLPVGLGLPYDGPVTLDLCTPPRLTGRTLWFYYYTITILGGLVVDRSELVRKEIELPSDSQ